ncbi:Clavaminate synthase-like protein [Moniliophthora roreri MCA 2997]|uniref:Clavaminate synthase-like protein n=1 Tax=Moniliophthora roreri (strain MCA 2997) TaxID=1381753 RepID=V2WUS9_MONRO|nr:Clavaminate synthase-like protein [Moniliophthora roreri MCA 2997]
MPGLTTRPEIPHYVPAQPTKEPLDYADLAVIDLAKARTTPEDLQALVEDIRTAMSTQGFFYVINHGYSPSEMERIFDIANVPFTQVPEDEKKLYHAKPHETGSFQGYKPRQYWVRHIEGGVRDQMEQYNINRNVARRTHPEAIRPFIPEVDAFARHNHFNVVQPILHLLALGLELPENTFVDMHDFNATGESFVRFMKYYPRSEEDEVKSKNVWFKGHTDFGTITLLYSQPVAALQILGLDGKWRWVRHMENAIVINAGDAMESLSGGYYKATIHRVVQPPADQRNVTRLGAYYFNIADDHIKLAPLTDSPVLQRVGIQRRFEDDKIPTMEEWRKSRTLAYGQVNAGLKVGEQHGEAKVDEEIINGVVVKHYK